MRILITVMIMSVLLVACKSKKTDKKEPGIPVVPLTDTTKTVVVSVDNDSVLLVSIANKVMTALKAHDYATLGSLVHPDGVRFSPYAYIDSASDKIIDAATISSWADKKKQTVILWGTIDPTDEPIKGKIDYYVDGFVYDADFLHPEKMAVNKALGHGNTINNIAEMYPGCDFVESHFSGFDKKYDGMDWLSLRLVFKKNNGQYALVGVIHDEWTT